MELMPHQKKIVKKSIKRLSKFGVVYNTSDTRSGKSIMTLQTAKELKVRSVVVVTTKKAIQDWYDDYYKGKYVTHFDLLVTNYESMHKHVKMYDMVVFDEATRLSSVGKPSLSQKRALELVVKSGAEYKILISATPSTEHVGQLYYPLKICGFWNRYTSFFDWFRSYGIPSTIRVAGGREVQAHVKYHDKKVLKQIKPFIVRATREEAGFKQHTTKVKTVVLKPKKITRKAYEVMKKDNIYEGVVADTAVKVAQKLQQICSGFIYGEDTTLKLGSEKQKYIIKSIDLDQKTVIYCLYKYEVELYQNLFREFLKEYSEFKACKSGVFVSQVASGARGLDLSSADRHIFTSLSWSGEVFQQAIDRQHKHDREREVCVEVLTLGEEYVDYQVLQKVKDKRDFQAKQLK